MPFTIPCVALPVVGRAWGDGEGELGVGGSGPSAPRRSGHLVRRAPADRDHFSGAAAIRSPQAAQNSWYAGRKNRLTMITATTAAMAGASPK